MTQLSFTPTLRWGRPTSEQNPSGKLTFGHKWIVECPICRDSWSYNFQTNALIWQRHHFCQAAPLRHLVGLR
jgi:hypothetical protein